jgi:hypothetical protein
MRSGGDAAGRAAALAEAEAAAAALSGPDATAAATYVKTMKSVAEKGVGHVASELQRLEGLLKSGSVAPGKKDAFTRRANVLAEFNEARAEKDEL